MISLQKNLNKFKAKIRELFFCNVEFTVAWEPSGCPVDPMRPRCGGRESEVSNCKYRGCIPGQITSTNGYQIFGVLSLSGVQCIGLEVRAVPLVSHCIRTEATGYRGRSPQICTVTDFEMETSNFVLFLLISIVSVHFQARYDETIHCQA